MNDLEDRAIAEYNAKMAMRPQMKNLIMPFWAYLLTFLNAILWFTVPIVIMLTDKITATGTFISVAIVGAVSIRTILPNVWFHTIQDNNELPDNYITGSWAFEEDEGKASTADLVNGGKYCVLDMDKNGTIGYVLLKEQNITHSQYWKTNDNPDITDTVREKILTKLDEKDGIKLEFYN